MKKSITLNNAALMTDPGYWLEGKLQRNGNKGYIYRHGSQTLTTTISPEQLKVRLIKQLQQLVPGLGDINLNYLPLATVCRIVNTLDMAKIITAVQRSKG